MLFATKSALLQAKSAETKRLCTAKEDVLHSKKVAGFCRDGMGGYGSPPPLTRMKQCEGVGTVGTVAHVRVV